MEENIKTNNVDNNTCNIVSNMKENKVNWGSSIGSNSIFFQEAICKGGYDKDDQWNS